MTMRQLEARLAEVSPSTLSRQVDTFVADLIVSFTRYAKLLKANVVRHRITYRQRTLFLTDRELAMLIDGLEARIDREEDDPANPERRPNVISWVILAEPQPREEA
jgi:hypothetical protein